MIITEEQRKSIPFQYAYNVLSGKIITGNKIKLAINRFFKLIKDAEKKGIYLDHDSGMDVIDFFPFWLTHTKGPLSDTPFVLSPYQQFTYYNIFAWKIKSSGNRLINTIYEKVARKNGKTSGLAGLGCYCLGFDNVSSPEIYVGATKELQAKTLWKQASDFIKISPGLNQMGYKVLQRDIKLAANLGNFTFLGGDSKTLDSLNPSVNFIDEYHAHKDSSILDVLVTAQGARQNPITYIITTAGTNIYSVCKHLEDDLTKILNGEEEDDHTFIMIHDLDIDDDWKDKDNWIKSNPNLQYNPPMMDHLLREYKSTKISPSKIPNFKTKYLNMWVDAPKVWIAKEYWQANKVVDFEGYKNYDELFIAKCKEFGSCSAVDLSTVKDLTSFAITTFPDASGNVFSKVFNFCPNDTIDTRSSEDGVPYKFWRDEKLLIATPGNVIDYDVVIDYIVKYYISYNISVVEFDRHNASHIVAILIELGIKVSYFEQGIMNMSYPTKQFEKQVLKNKFKHDGNVVLEWALSGCVLYVDANENIKVHKGRSHKGKKRIDSIIALIMAYGSTFSDEEESNSSKYNDESQEITFGL